MFSDGVKCLYNPVFTMLKGDLLVVDSSFVEVSDDICSQGGVQVFAHDESLKKYGNALMAGGMFYSSPDAIFPLPGPSGDMSRITPGIVAGNNAGNQFSRLVLSRHYSL